MHETPRPLYIQLAAELAEAISRGEWRPGERLPTVRVMAAERGLDVNTVNRAYQLLARRGLVEAHARRGTLVCARMPDEHHPVALPDDITLRIAGSHDFALDLLARGLRERGLQIELTLNGSAAGLQALAGAQAHLAGVHLRDDDGRGYNHDAAMRALPGQPLLLLTLAERSQGLLVRRGNPLGLRGVGDLARHGVRLANRQRGSGTRILLDRLLLENGLDGQALPGYERELGTHLAVAAAVAGGSADVGLGVAAAAGALGLDFVPLLRERYDLVLPEAAHEAAWFGPLIEGLAAPAFRRAIEALGGYDATYTAWMRTL